MSIRHLHGNLIFPAGGGAWAVWRIRARSSRHAARETQMGVYGLTQSALLGLQGRPLLLSLCARRSREQLRRAMQGGIDPAQRPQWTQLASDYAEIQDGAAAYVRTHWLAVPLTVKGKSGGLTEAFSAAAATLHASLGLAPAPVRAAAVADATAAAEKIEQNWPGGLRLERATPADVAWIFAHSAARGLPGGTPSLPDEGEERVPGFARIRGDVLQGSAMAAIEPVRLTEGGDRSDGDTGGERLRRYVRVDSSEGSAYQCLLAVADLPEEYAFPGPQAGWLAAVDNFDFPVDWGVQLTVTPNDQAQARVRRHIRNFTDQVTAWDEDAAGAPPDLHNAQQGLAKVAAELADDSLQPLLGATCILAVGGATVPEALERAARVTAAYRNPGQVALQRPVGGQRALWESMLPGFAPRVVAESYRQYMLPRDLAAAMPFVADAGGDDTGMPLLYSTDTKTLRVVLLDLIQALRENRSASMGIVSDSGRGKSWLLKALQYHAVLSGMQVIAVDTTHRGELADFARVLPARVHVVRVDEDPEASLDPLRILPGQAGIRIAENFLSVMLGTSPLDASGVALSRAVRTAAASPRTRCLPGVLAALREAASSDSAAAPVATALAAITDRADAAAVFDSTLPAFGTGDVDYLLFHLPRLRLPSKGQMNSETGRRRLLPEQVFSQGLLYLTAALTKEIAFSNLSRFTLLPQDEAWRLSDTVEGEALQLEGVRDGRKHLTAIAAANQTVESLGSPEVRKLIPTRITLGHDDDDVAAATGRFLGLGDEPHAVALIKSLNARGRGRGAPTAGEALLRDRWGGITRGQVVSPPYAHVREAMRTDPIEDAAA